VIRFSIFLLLTFFSLTAFAQDSIPNSDTISKRADSVRIIKHRLRVDSIGLKNDSLIFWRIDTSWKVAAAKYSQGNFLDQLKKDNDFFGAISHPLRIESDRKTFKGKEDFFYVIVGILLFFAFLRNAFPKYVNDLFRVAFKTTLKQRQIGEQLIQAPLPSLFMNIFFLVSGALYADLLFRHYQLGEQYSFWILFSYILLGLAVIYLVKYITLKLSGLLFNIAPTTDAYIFIVFMINKIIGIMLLPFLILLAFTQNEFYEFGLILSFIGIFILVFYRFILAYGLVHNQIRLKPFHFFLYLCCFEIAPLLLIYKLLMLWV
jgi:uncharacterized protein DUF4271